MESWFLRSFEKLSLSLSTRHKVTTEHVLLCPTLSFCCFCTTVFTSYFFARISMWKGSSIGSVWQIGLKKRRKDPNNLTGAPQKKWRINFGKWYSLLYFMNWNLSKSDSHMHKENYQPFWYAAQQTFILEKILNKPFIISSNDKWSDNLVQMKKLIRKWRLSDSKNSQAEKTFREVTTVCLRYRFI